MHFKRLLVTFVVTMSAQGSFIRELARQSNDVPAVDDVDESSDWTEYKQSFNKTYISAEDEQYRRYVWEDNIAVITKHNKEAAMGRHSYWMGVNQFTDMTIDEFESMLMTGFLLPETNATVNDNFDGAGMTMNLPLSVDWRKKHLVTDVKNQKKCGSCWAFSATGAIEGQHAKKTGKLVSLSEQQLVDCSRTYGNMGCKGGWPIKAYQYLMRQKGLDTEQCYPYKGKDNQCRAKGSCVGARLSSYKAVPQGENNLQRAVAEVGPISVVVRVSNKLMHYKSGIFVDDGTCSRYRLHAILAVGYEPSFWIIKNSWGSRWGMNGYIRWARGKNMCGVASQATYPIV